MHFEFIVRFITSFLRHNFIETKLMREICFRNTILYGNKREMKIQQIV